MPSVLWIQQIVTDFISDVLTMYKLTVDYIQLTLMRGAVATHVCEKGLYLKAAILNSQPLLKRCL